MADMGIGLGFGAGGVEDALSRIFQQRVMAAQVLNQQRQLEEQAAWRQMQQQALSDYRQQSIADRNARTLDLAGERIAGELQPGQSVSDPKSIGILQTSGRGNLLKTNPDVVGSQFIGNGGQPDFVPGQQPGTTFTGTEDQIAKQTAENQRQAAEAATERYRAGELERQNAAADETKRHNRAMESNAANGTYGFLQTYNPDNTPGPVVRTNNRSGAVEAVPGVGAIKPGPGAAQAAQLAQSKKDALGSLDQLDQSIEAAKDLIGPGSGRFTNIQQMIGSADPRAQALGTKLLLAKMQVDHAATGTVRAAASPQILARWDNLLANKVTPEGLHASVQAMREILQGDQGAGGPKVIRYDMDGNPIKGKD